MAEYICEMDEQMHATVYEDMPIVRCRDCKHGYPFCDSSSYADKINCQHFAQWDYCNDEPEIWLVEPDGFCAWGERRGDDAHDYI